MHTLRYHKRTWQIGYGTWNDLVIVFRRGSLIDTVIAGFVWGLVVALQCIWGAGWICLLACYAWRMPVCSNRLANLGFNCRWWLQKRVSFPACPSEPCYLHCHTETDRGIGGRERRSSRSKVFASPHEEWSVKQREKPIERPCLSSPIFLLSLFLQPYHIYRMIGWFWGDAAVYCSLRLFILSSCINVDECMDRYPLTIGDVVNRQSGFKCFVKRLKSRSIEKEITIYCLI